MARRRRSDEIDESVVGAYHVWSRTVRRAFLTGVDAETGVDHSYRKELLEQRLEALASVFAVEVLDHTVLDNHFHAILRNRPDLVAGWTDEEVGRRWLRLKRSELELNDEPTIEQLAEFLTDPARVARARKALSSISELMAHLKEPLARHSNFVDRCCGNFWQGRFRARRLNNDAALLVCSLYVNMNPIRAGLADKPENAEHTSMHARLQDRMAGDAELSRSGWLAAVHVDGDGYDGVADGRRASNKGYLEIVFREYLELLDALIRRERIEKAGGASSDYPSVLERLGVTAAMWESAVQVTSRRFARELDIMAMMFAEARRRG
jgi:REP element-mobilizing transposase RayT